MLQILLDAGACAAGCVHVSRLEMADPPAGAESLLCAAFPYGPADITPGPVSVYARGQDYHRVLRARLEPAAQKLAQRFPGHRFDFYADASPFPEVKAAALAGLGVMGDHGLLIVPGAGSYVFLGFLATDAHLPETGGSIGRCSGCGACRKACPGQALRERLDETRCLSAISQQRGQLSPQQTALIGQNHVLWGCDRCQLVCPENRHRTVPPLPEFAPLPDPTGEELTLSDRAFRRIFDGRAFTWRGVQPLRRNFEIIHKE